MNWDKFYELLEQYEKMREEEEFQKDQFASWWTFIHGLEESEELTEEEINLRTWAVLGVELDYATKTKGVKVEIELDVSWDKLNHYRMCFYPLVTNLSENTIELRDRFSTNGTMVEFDVEDFRTIALDEGTYVDSGFVLQNEHIFLTVTWEGFPKWTGKPSIQGVEYIGE